MTLYAVYIEAIQFTGDNHEEVINFIIDSYIPSDYRNKEDYMREKFEINKSGKKILWHAKGYCAQNINIGNYVVKAKEKNCWIMTGSEQIVKWLNEVER